LSFCITCPTGTYNLDFNRTTCDNCPDNAFCYEGNMISADEGYWTDAEHPAGNFYKCYPPISKCVSGLNASLCGTGYQGVLCGVCMDDYQFSAGQCLECPEGDLPWPSYVVMVLVLLIAVATIVGMSLDREADKHRELRELFDIMDFNDGVSDELIDKADLRWVIQQLTISDHESLENAQRNLLNSLDKLPIEEISFSLFVELVTEGTTDTYASNNRNQAHLASLGAAIQTQQLTDQLSPDETVDELDVDMEVDEMEVLDEMESAADDLAEAAEAISEAASALSGPMKIIVTQFQILSAVTVTMPIGWPDLISELSLSAAFLRLDLPAVFGLGCIWSVNQVMFAVVGTTFVLVVLAIVAALMRLFFDRSRKDATNFFYTWAQTVAFLVYPEVAMTCLGTYHCIDIHGTWYKSNDLSHTCYDSEWEINAAVATFGTIFYVIGIPLWMALVLVRNKHKLYIDETFMIRYGVIYQRYEPEYYYWELTETLRKLILTSVIIFIHPGSARQTSFALCCSFGFLALHFKFQPFDEDYDDNLQTMSLTSACLTMLYGCILAAGEDSTFFMILVFVSIMSTVAYFLMVFIRGPLPVLVNAFKVGVTAMLGMFSRADTFTALLEALKNVPYDTLGTELSGSPSSKADAQTAVVEATIGGCKLELAVSESESESELELESEPESNTAPVPTMNATPDEFVAVSESESESESEKESNEMAAPVPTMNTKPDEMTSMESIRETAARLFYRYDLDESGTVNNRQELQQITINLTFKLGLQVRNDAMQNVIDSASMSDTTHWSLDEYTVWFVENMLPLSRSHAMGVLAK